MYVCVYMYTCIHVYMYMYMNIYIYNFNKVRRAFQWYRALSNQSSTVFLVWYIFAFALYIYIYIYIYVYVNVYVYANVFCICICIYIHKVAYSSYRSLRKHRRCFNQNCTNWIKGWRTKIKRFDLLIISTFKFIFVWFVILCFFLNAVQTYSNFRFF